YTTLFRSIYRDTGLNHGVNDLLGKVCEGNGGSSTLKSFLVRLNYGLVTTDYAFDLSGHPFWPGAPGTGSLPTQLAVPKLVTVEGVDIAPDKLFGSNSYNVLCRGVAYGSPPWITVAPTDGGLANIISVHPLMLSVGGFSHLFD